MKNRDDLQLDSDKLGWQPNNDELGTLYVIEPQSGVALIDAKLTLENSFATPPTQIQLTEEMLDENGNPTAPALPPPRVVAQPQHPIERSARECAEALTKSFQCGSKSGYFRTERSHPQNGHCFCITNIAKGFDKDHTKANAIPIIEATKKQETLY